jgi:hypothetical protein
LSVWQFWKQSRREILADVLNSCWRQEIVPRPRDGLHKKFLIHQSGHILMVDEARRAIDRFLPMRTIPTLSPAGSTATSTSRKRPAEKKNASTNGNGNGESWELELLAAMLAFRKGDFTTRLPEGWTGVRGKIADAFNDVLGMSERRSGEAARVSRVVGKEGRLRQRIVITGMVGGWADEVQALNTLMDDLVRPTTDFSTSGSPWPSKWMAARWRVSSCIPPSS